MQGIWLKRSTPASSLFSAAASRRTGARPENLFIRICMHGFVAGRGYTPSEAKRELFAEFTDDEIAALETAIQTAFQSA